MREHGTITAAGAPDMRRVEVVAPNFKRRLSGVTSTIVQLVPVQARDLAIVTLGPGLPPGLPKMRWWQVPALLMRPQDRPFRIWHARRNTEMIAGVILRHALRAPVRLVFTSAAQRRHKPFTRWLMRRMDAVVATSERSGSFLEVPHRVVMHGVDTERFHPPRVAGDEWTATGLPGRYGVGCFGRVRHQKGTDLFVEAMIALLPHHPDWTAVVLGRVTAENRAFAEALERRIAAAGLAERIRFLGEVDDVRPWYRRISLYVAPSRNEGFGLTPLEAMASATPVVASDAGAFSELVEDGVTGHVVAAGDLDGMIEAVGHFMRDDAARLAAAEAALWRARHHFPLAREADALQKVYEWLWGRNEGRSIRHPSKEGP